MAFAGCLQFNVTLHNPNETDHHYNIEMTFEPERFGECSLQVLFSGKEFYIRYVSDSIPRKELALEVFKSHSDLSDKKKLARMFNGKDITFEEFLMDSLKKTILGPFSFKTSNIGQAPSRFYREGQKMALGVSSLGKISTSMC